MFSNNKKSSPVNYLLVTIIVAFSAVLIYAINFYIHLLKNENFSKQIEQFAQFGDFFGGTLNPLLSFLTIILLLFTIYIQTKELESTREELEKSRIAQEEQSDSLELQNIATHQQIFENTFFKLVELFTETRKGIRYYHPIGRKEHYSIKAISYLLQLLKKDYKNNYEEFNTRYEFITGAYFGQIYQIIKFINESDIKNKQRYINIFRAQFTEKELEFLFYHCLGSVGKRKFKPLIEKYEFFEHISLNNEIKPLLKKYKASAFGNRHSIVSYLKS